MENIESIQIQNMAELTEEEIAGKIETLNESV